MKKNKANIIKETIIFFILLILIMLILAVALYDFIPTNMNLPETIEYSSDSATTLIKQEIAYTNGGDITADEATQKELITSLKSYSIEASDLTVYGQKNLYNSGNSNPFDYAEEAVAENKPTNNATNSTEQKPTQAETTNATSSNTSDTTSGTFFENSASK